MSLGQIDHLIVLMLENRSFDHVLGLRRGVDGILDARGKPKFWNPNAKGTKVMVSGDAPFAIPTKHGQGPFHNLTDVSLQLFGSKTPKAGAVPTMSGFLLSYLEALQHDTHGNFTDADTAVVLKSFNAGALSSITALADHFVLCDAWFSEVPGPTHPNRLYVHAGTSAGFVHNVFDRPFDLMSIYELLGRNGKTWAVYDFDLNDVKVHFTRIANQLDSFRRFRPDFAQDVETGKLPNYSFIMPRFNGTAHAGANDEHPPHDVRWGEYLIADVYDTLRAHEAVWNKSALVVTYDEHGGFFDHVPPPAAVNPDGIDSPRPDDNFHGAPPPPFKFDRLGVRVPAVIASPWVAKGVVTHERLQHTSILRTVRDRFGIAQSLSKREAEAKSFAFLFDQTAPRPTPQTLPRPALSTLPPGDHHANPGHQWPSEVSREMMAGLLRATRPSHPEDDHTSPVVPTTQAKVAELALRRGSQHSRWMRGLPR
jgi:phospholipase C